MRNQVLNHVCYNFFTKVPKIMSVSQSDFKPFQGSDKALRPFKSQVKSALIIGLGLSGRGAANLLLAQGIKVSGVDKNLKQLKLHKEILRLEQAGLKVFSEEEPLAMSDYDLLVISPGVAPSHPLIEQALDLKIETIGEIELACRFIKNPCVGITGTNGKTTVTLMVAHILNACGIKARALGNVGTPLSMEVLEEANPNEVFVIELSSYQLETMQAQILDAAVLLNITPDHLDRYRSMEHYAKAKARIANCLKREGVLYLDEASYSNFPHLFKDKAICLYGQGPLCVLRSDADFVCFKEKILYEWPAEYRGKFSHDVENALAAFGICHTFGISGSQFLKALKAFKKPPHRIEFVDSIKGVAYYDDSKGTNLDAVVKAVHSLQGSIILIAGGVDKGAAYTPWIDAFGGKVKLVLAIGQAANKIKQDLGDAINVEFCASMEEAVNYAAFKAQPGDSVLLSPGCSSFDMFRDYAHRGDVFKNNVKSLKR